MLKKRILSIVLALTMLMVPGAYAAQPAKDDMRGVWVASVHNIDFPSEQGMTATSSRPRPILSWTILPQWA